MRRQGSSLAPSTTGVQKWWHYFSRTIPGVGSAMVKVANLNLLVDTNDAYVQEGLSLAFLRVFNSQSAHTARNGDGSGFGLYGNRWTNNLHVQLGWTPGKSNVGTVSVYTADGPATTTAAKSTPWLSARQKPLAFTICWERPLSAAEGSPASCNGPQGQV